jgi:predicted enzyme related to lactoylglutathione lyase
MKQQVAIITLGINDLDRSKKFYTEGFGWVPLVEDEETVMYQMNGFVLSTWIQSALEADITRSNLPRGAALTLAHNVETANQVQETLDRLVLSGGTILRKADAPIHGGIRGYIADPDEHIWEIIWNPVWKVNEKGFVTFSP